MSGPNLTPKRVNGLQVVMDG